MGYRSDVGFVVKKNNPKIKTLKFLNEDAEIYGKDDEVLFYYDYVKWYPEYDRKQQLTERILDSFYDDVYFIRLGEDAEDNEFKGGLMDNSFELSFIRRIDFNL